MFSGQEIHLVLMKIDVIAFNILSFNKLCAVYTLRSNLKKNVDESFIRLISGIEKDIRLNICFRYRQTDREKEREKYSSNLLMFKFKISGVETF